MLGFHLVCACMWYHMFTLLVSHAHFHYHMLPTCIYCKPQGWLVGWCYKLATEGKVSENKSHVYVTWPEMETAHSFTSAVQLRSFSTSRTLAFVMILSSVGFGADNKFKQLSDLQPSVWLTILSTQKPKSLDPSLCTGGRMLHHIIISVIKFLN